MKVTDKQRRAIEYIDANPGASVADIATAAGASTTGSNDAEFLRRLIDSGLVQVVLTGEVNAAIEDVDF